MMLDWKISVGSLHPVSFADARDLGREPSLFRTATNVLNDRITEDQIEGLIGERELDAVAQDHALPRPDFVPRPLLIQQYEPRHHGRQPPDIDCAPDVEDAHLAREPHGFRQQGHALRSKMALEGMGERHPDRSWAAWSIRSTSTVSSFTLY